MQKYKSNITTTSGTAVRGVPVLVIDEDGNNAALFLDRAGTVPAQNPLTTGPDGVFYFYAVNGRYSLRTTVDGVTITDDDVVLMMDPEEITVAGPIAEAVAAAQAAAIAAEFAVEDSGIPDLVAAAQNAVVDSNNAVTQATSAANNAAISKTGADSARDDAVIAKNAAEAALDSFAARYLGAKAVAPTTDNDGGALLPGALYWDTVIGAMRAWSGSVWVTLPATTAAAISNTPAGSIAATTLQAAINELDSEKAPLTGGGASGTWPISVTGSATTLTNARTINGVSFNGSANISIAAAAIPNTPAGSIAATTVQAALNELDAEKVAKTDVIAIAKGGTGATSANAAADAIGAFRRGTLLGTVSQSAGVPTGAVIERGSNANGEYVRYADGTQICTTARLRQGVTMTTPANALFFTGAAINHGALPAQFIAPPCQSQSITNESGIDSLVNPSAAATTTNWGIFQHMSVADRPSYDYVDYLTAVGRWY